MMFDGNVFTSFILMPLIIGAVVTVLLLKAVIKAHKENRLKLRNCIIGLVVCVAINIFGMIITLGFLGVPILIVMCGPLAIFSFLTTKTLVKGKRWLNPVVSVICKAAVILLLWFLAFFPFSLFVIMRIGER